MIKWLLKKSIWATEANKWHGVSQNDESDVSTPSPAVSTFYGVLTYFWANFIYFLELFGRPMISSRRHKSQNFKFVILLIVPWGHPKGVSQTLFGPTMCFHLFLIEWVTFTWVV